MSEKAIHVRDKIKHAMLNWTELSNREIMSYLLLLAESIEELDKPPAIPPITRPATAEGGDWRV